MAKIRVFDGKIDFDNGVLFCTCVQFLLFEPSFNPREYQEIVFYPQNIEGSYVILDNKQIPFINSELSLDDFLIYANSLSKYMDLIENKNKNVALLSKETNKVVLFSSEKYTIDDSHVWVDVPKAKRDKIAVGNIINLDNSKFEIDNTEDLQRLVAENTSKLKVNREKAWEEGVIHVDKMNFSTASSTLTDISAIKISLLDKGKQTAQYTDALTKKSIELTLAQASEVLDKIIDFRNKVYSTYRSKKDKIAKEKTVENLINFDLRV